MLQLSNYTDVRKKSILSPNLKALGTWGMLQRQGFVSNFLFYFYFFCLVYFVTQYIELWVLRDNQDAALKNLSYSLLSTVCYVKAGTFHIWKKDWTKIIDYISDVESNHNSRKDQKIKSVIEQYEKYSKTVTYLYWGLVASTVSIVILAPILASILSPQSKQRILDGVDPYPEIMSSWMPFDKSRGAGYIASLTIQGSVYVWGGGLVAFYDSTAFVVMTFFTGQFKILKISCESIFEDDTEALVLERIQDCYKQHKNLIKHCQILNSLLSPVQFLYVIVCSIMFCAAATRLTSEASGIMQKIWLAEYLIALIFQLFLYCWHSSEVYYSSHDVEYGVFSSTWWKGDAKLRRNVLLLHGKLRKSVVFTAGPFYNLEIATFIAILRGSYSYYTLLK